VSHRRKPSRLAALTGLLLVAVSLVAVSGPADAAAVPTAPAPNKSYWLAFGWPLDHPKSLAFPGGALAPGRRDAIQYYLTSGSTTYVPDDNVSNLRSAVDWSLGSGYLPSPVSRWSAGSARVTVQHFANSVLGGAATAVFTRVTVANTGATSLSRILNVTAPPTTEIPLTGAPSGHDQTSMYYDLSVPAGRSVSKDFVTLAAGTATSEQLAAQGTFDANYRAMAKYWNDRLSRIALPTSLPDPQLITMYKASVINNWELVYRDANNDWEQRTAGGTQAPGLWSYDAVNNNDEVDIVQQYIKLGDYATAKKIMSAAPFQAIPDKWTDNGYLDAALKFILPFDLYQRLANDPRFFTPAVKTLIKSSARKIGDYVVTTEGDPHRGLIQISNDFDNARDGSRGDYLINDDFAAIFALRAYQNLANAFGRTDPAWQAEARWAKNLASSINTSLNTYLEAHTFARIGKRQYYACLDACAFANSYNGNYLGTTWLMSALPWDGALAGNSLGGTWRDVFDNTNHAAFTARATQAPILPAHSWGAWWSDFGYGNAFNAASGVQLLASSDLNLRTEAMSNLQWLLANQSAPMQWGESFAKGSWSKPLADNNAYGMAGSQKAILETSVSVAGDGTAIIGRGLPTSWITSGKPVSWTGVPVGGGATIGFTLTPLPRNQVRLTLKGNKHTPVRFELPLFVNNIVAASKGSVDSARGSVALRAGVASTTVTVRTEAAAPLVVASSTKDAVAVGRSGDFQSVGQGFFANSSPTVTGVRLKLRRAGGGSDRSDVTVGLHATVGGVPVGDPLATATIPAAKIGRSFTAVTAPLSYDGLVDGRGYAIVVSQRSASSTAYYQWATTGRSGGPLDLTSSDGTRWTNRSAASGNAWLALDVKDSLSVTDLSTTGTAGYYFGQAGDQVGRGQLFIANGITSLDNVRVKVARTGGDGQTDMTVRLFATEDGVPTGNPLASTTVSAARIGTSPSVVKVPLRHGGIVPGKTYVIALSQSTPGDAVYVWTASGSNGLYGFGKFRPDGTWTDESNLGDAWLQVSGSLK
jgi:hypothetical protein